MHESFIIDRIIARLAWKPQQSWDNIGVHVQCLLKISSQAPKRDVAIIVN